MSMLPILRRHKAIEDQTSWAIGSGSGLLDSDLYITTIATVFLIPGARTDNELL